LDCEGGQFSHSPWKTIDAESLKVGADVYLRNGFRSKGTVDFRSASIAGNLDCDGGYFDNIKRDALGFNSAKIEGSVLLRRRFEAHGTLLFLAANIGSVLELGTGKVEENANLADAILDLRHAKVEGLLNARQSWPKKGKLLVHGFVFHVLDEGAQLTGETQAKWLRLQDHFDAQPYEQMAAVLRNMGLQEEAVKVMIAKNTDVGRLAIAEDRSGANQWKKLWDWFWYKLFGKLIGYGYRSWNALFTSFLVIAIGAVVFKIGYLADYIIPTANDAYLKGTAQLRETYPKFNTLIYSIETFVYRFIDLDLKLWCATRW
jgi:hypothetical protein